MVESDERTRVEKGNFIFLQILGFFYLVRRIIRFESATQSNHRIIV